MSCFVGGTSDLAVRTGVFQFANAFRIWGIELEQRSAKRQLQVSFTKQCAFLQCYFNLIQNIGSV